jgi:hypothetical protein
MSALWHMCVLIPARDEEELLPKCLASVFEARKHLLPTTSCDIVVAVDRSTDKTLDIANKMLKGEGAVVRSMQAQLVKHAPWPRKSPCEGTTAHSIGAGWRIPTQIAACRSPGSPIN